MKNNMEYITKSITDIVTPQHINTAFLLYSLLEEFSEAMFEPVTELNNLYAVLNAKQVGGEANV